MRKGSCLASYCHSQNECLLLHCLSVVRVKKMKSRINKNVNQSKRKTLLSLCLAGHLMEVRQQSGYESRNSIYFVVIHLKVAT